MPTYEYQCDKCGRIFEIRQRISEAPLQTCEACGGAVRRLLSAAPFILKGEGWYVTDYPSSARKKGLESEKPAASGDGKKDDKKKDDTKTEKPGEKKSEAAAKPTTSAPASTAPPTPSTSPSSSPSD